MTDDLRTSNCDLVRRYIDLINAWDYDGMRKMLAPEMVFEMRFPLPGMPPRIEGRDALLDYQRKCNMLIVAENLHDLWLETLYSDPGEVVAEYRSNMTMADPSIKYANEYFARFTIRNGLIYRFQENYDSHRGVVALSNNLTQDGYATKEEHRQTVLQFCRHLSDRDFEKMARITTDDMEWFVVGQPGRIKNAGTHSFDAIRQILEHFLNRLDTFAFTVTSTTAEDDRVTVEATSHGTLAGKPYSNQYLMQYVVADNRIKSVREFFDQSSVDAFTESMES